MNKKPAKSVVVPQSVHWFDGPACLGKTIFATAIERRYGFMIYHRFALWFWWCTHLIQYGSPGIRYISTVHPCQRQYLEPAVSSRKDPVRMIVINRIRMGHKHPVVQNCDRWITPGSVSIRKGFHRRVTQLCRRLSG